MALTALFLGLFSCAIPASLWAGPFSDPADNASPSVADSTISTKSVPMDVSAERQKVLVEMWTRRILGPESDTWTSGDYALLARMREAETSGALDLLRNDLGTLRGYAVDHRGAQGHELWLTRVGFDRYVFIKSQRARKYFEAQGTDTKFVFRLRDMDRKRLFDGRGLLTPAGEAVYDKILKGQSVQWRDAAGAVVGNFRP